MKNVILQGDVRERLRELADESVHCVVTSPPYWGLRDYSVAGQLGLESTPEEYVATMVEVFREVRRVLRRDGTLWLNMGDSYNSIGGTIGGTKYAENNHVRERQADRKSSAGLKPKDLVGIPWRLAFALQADGWWLRSDIIWSKPNPMPESVGDRPTKSHEYLFLLSKSATYYYDAEAIKETVTGNAHEGRRDRQIMPARNGVANGGAAPSMPRGLVSGRNARSVWEIATEPYAEAHFATYPQALVKRCILAGTSEHGCCSVCGAPWVRVVEREYRSPLIPGQKKYEPDTWKGSMDNPRLRREDGTFLPRDEQRPPVSVRESITRMGDGVDVHTTGWAPGCKHEASIEPAIILDPFMGSGTTALVALTAFRDYVGIELNPAYVEMAEKRIAMLKNQGRLM